MSKSNATHFTVAQTSGCAGLGGAVVATPEAKSALSWFLTTTLPLHNASCASDAAESVPKSLPDPHAVIDAAAEPRSAKVPHT